MEVHGDDVGVGVVPHFPYPAFSVAPSVTVIAMNRSHIDILPRFAINWLFVTKKKNQYIVTCKNL